VVVWTRTRRRPAVAIGIGVAMVILVELAQVFVRSRYADVTDVLTGSLGVALGVGAALRFAAADGSRAVGRSSPVAGSLSAALGAVIWIVVLLGYHWYPFNFSFDPVRVKAGVNQLLTVPFSWYYWGTEFHAFTEASRKTLLALPLGVFFRLAWPKDYRTWVRRLRLFIVAVGSFGLLFGIETGQVFLPGRTPDVTDAIIGDFGVLVGFWLAGVLASPLRARTVRPPAHSVSLRP
jgi:glycopeptide antibiotics resistance protein